MEKCDCMFYDSGNSKLGYEGGNKKSKENVQTTTEKKNIAREKKQIYSDIYDTYQFYIMNSRC
jgi:hypothetical protein